MKDKSFPITAGGLLVLIGLASIYVFDFGQPEDVGSTPASTVESQIPGQSSEETAATIAARQRDRTTMRLGDAEHPSQTDRVNPVDYSSNPPKSPHEKEIIAMATRKDMDPLAKADQLLGRIHLLPPEGKVLAMEYATKLIPDRHYEQFRPRIFKAGDSDELRETVLLDLMTRGDNLRMTSMLEFLRQPVTTTHEEIREFFVAYLDKDHGIDPEKWAPDVKQWLAQNPED